MSSGIDFLPFQKNKISPESPYIFNLSIPGTRSEVMTRVLSDQGVLVSPSSACSSRKKRERVQKGYGKDSIYIEGSLRISISPTNTDEEINNLVFELEKAVKELRVTYDR